ncbi:MAG: phasin family protein [Rhizobiaceae bacterium]|nr:phasin family protein [Rhizobiaceae bacterium]
MSKNFEDLNAFAKDTLDNGLKAFAAFSKGAQAIAVETGEYTKKTLEDGASAFQGMLSAKSFEKAVEIQTSYAKTSYEALVAEATKLSGLYADLAKDAYKPFEGALAKVK